MEANLDRMVTELEGAVELARQISGPRLPRVLIEARMSVIGQRLNQATEYYNAIGEELDERVNALRDPAEVADVDADAWRDGDVTCPSCGAEEAPLTETLYGGRVTQLRCSNCGYAQEAS